MTGSRRKRKSSGESREQGDYAERYRKIYSGIFPSTQARADWSGPVVDKIEAERRERLPADKLVERQSWRDRRLMALAAHKRRADRDIGR